MENVIQFPRVLTKNTSPISDEERSEIITKMRADLSDEISEDIMQSVINILISCGLITSELIVKDAIFLEETIKAVVYRYKNIPHQFHSLIDDVIVMPDDEENSEDKNEEEMDILLTLEDSGVKIE